MTLQNMRCAVCCTDLWCILKTVHTIHNEKYNTSRTTTLFLRSHWRATITVLTAYIDYCWWCQWNGNRWTQDHDQWLSRVLFGCVRLYALCMQSVCISLLLYTNDVTAILHNWRNLILVFSHYLNYICMIIIMQIFYVWWRVFGVIQHCRIVWLRISELKDLNFITPSNRIIGIKIE